MTTSSLPPSPRQKTNPSLEVTSGQEPGKTPSNSDEKKPQNHATLKDSIKNASNTPPSDAVLEKKNPAVTQSNSVQSQSLSESSSHHVDKEKINPNVVFFNECLNDVKNRLIFLQTARENNASSHFIQELARMLSSDMGELREIIVETNNGDPDALTENEWGQLDTAINTFNDCLNRLRTISPVSKTTHEEISAKLGNQGPISNNQAPVAPEVLNNGPKDPPGNIKNKSKAVPPDNTASSAISDNAQNIRNRKHPRIVAQVENLGDEAQYLLDNAKKDPSKLAGTNKELKQIKNTLREYGIDPKASEEEKKVLDAKIKGTIEHIEKCQKALETLIDKNLYNKPARFVLKFVQEGGSHFIAKIVVTQIMNSLLSTVARGGAAAMVGSSIGFAALATGGGAWGAYHLYTKYKKGAAATPGYWLQADIAVGFPFLMTAIAGGVGASLVSSSSTADLATAVNGTLNNFTMPSPAIFSPAIFNPASFLNLNDTNITECVTNVASAVPLTQIASAGKMMMAASTTLAGSVIARVMRQGLQSSFGGFANTTGLKLTRNGKALPKWDQFWVNVIRDTLYVVTSMCLNFMFSKLADGKVTAAQFTTEPRAQDMLESMVNAMGPDLAGYFGPSLNEGMDAINPDLAKIIYYKLDQFIASCCGADGLPPLVLENDDPAVNYKVGSHARDHAAIRLLNGPTGSDILPQIVNLLKEAKVSPALIDSFRGLASFGTGIINCMRGRYLAHIKDVHNGKENPTVIEGLFHGIGIAVYQAYALCTGGESYFNSRKEDLGLGINWNEAGEKDLKRMYSVILTTLEGDDKDNPDIDHRTDDNKDLDKILNTLVGKNAPSDQHVNMLSQLRGLIESQFQGLIESQTDEPDILKGPYLKCQIALLDKLISRSKVAQFGPPPAAGGSDNFADVEKRLGQVLKRCEIAAEQYGAEVDIYYALEQLKAVYPEKDAQLQERLNSYQRASANMIDGLEGGPNQRIRNLAGQLLTALERINDRDNDEFSVTVDNNNDYLDRRSLNESIQSKIKIETSTELSESDKKIHGVLNMLPPNDRKGWMIKDGIAFKHVDMLYGKDEKALGVGGYKLIPASEIDRCVNSKTKTVPTVLEAYRLPQPGPDQHYFEKQQYDYCGLHVLNTLIMPLCGDDLSCLETQAQFSQFLREKGLNIGLNGQNLEKYVTQEGHNLGSDLFVEYFNARLNKLKPNLRVVKCDVLGSEVHTGAMKNDDAVFAGLTFNHHGDNDQPAPHTVSLIKIQEGRYVVLDPRQPKIEFIEAENMLSAAKKYYQDHAFRPDPKNPPPSENFDLMWVNDLTQ
jgi:hypothetical protein